MTEFYAQFKGVTVAVGSYLDDVCEAAERMYRQQGAFGHPTGAVQWDPNSGRLVHNGGATDWRIVRPVVYHHDRKGEDVYG